MLTQPSQFVPCSCFQQHGTLVDVELHTGLQHILNLGLIPRAWWKRGEVCCSSGLPSGTTQSILVIDFITQQQKKNNSQATQNTVGSQFLQVKLPQQTSQINYTIRQPSSRPVTATYPKPTANTTVATTLSVGRACKMHDMAVQCYLKAGRENKVPLLSDLLLGLMQALSNRDSFTAHRLPLTFCLSRWTVPPSIQRSIVHHTRSVNECSLHLLAICQDLRYRTQME